MSSSLDDWDNCPVPKVEWVSRFETLVRFDDPDIAEQARDALAVALQHDPLVCDTRAWVGGNEDEDPVTVVLQGGWRNGQRGGVPSEAGVLNVLESHGLQPMYVIEEPGDI